MRLALSIAIAVFLWSTFLYELTSPWIRGEL